MKFRPFRCVENTESLHQVHRPASELTDHATQRKWLIAAATRRFDVIRYYIEIAGLHPDAGPEGKPSALCYAALNGDHCLMKYLVKMGADVNYTDRLGNRPLHYAALGNSAYSISWLLKSAAELNATNLNGKTAFDLSVDRKCSGCRTLLACHQDRQNGTCPVRKHFH